MQADTVSMYSKALLKQLADAGLQGALQTDAFKLLLQYMTNEQADPQIMAVILEQLKQGEFWDEPILGLSAACLCLLAQPRLLQQLLCSSYRATAHVAVTEPLELGMIVAIAPRPQLCVE